ncbi:MAG TPA: homoserine kinase [Coriobacteriia bacterium]
MDSVTVRVPATSANLGSGFDSFGLALGLHNRVSAELSVSGSWHMQVVGHGESDPGLALDENRVVVSMRRLFAEADRTELAAHVFCRNGVPVGRGLGSSSAAIVGGLVAANELIHRPFDTQRLFELAVEIEGHPDNVAAALFGGFTMCWGGDEPQVARVEPAGGLAAVCVVSDAPLATVKAREMLPGSVPHADAAFNLGRAGLLTAAIALGRCDLLGPGMADRLHEPYRWQAVPDLGDVVSILLEAGAHGAALSGSGPTVVGLVCGSDDDEALERAHSVAARASAAVGALAGRQAPLVLSVDRGGAALEA